MTGPSGGSNVLQACAACKHQRRKCAPDCVLAPFFPPHRQAEFLNVHKLFGIRNIINTVKKVEANRREDAIRSMIHEAYYRAIDPVGGAYRILNNLEMKFTQMKAELDLVHQQLAIFRSVQINGESDQILNTSTFYSGLMAQNVDNVFQQQYIRSVNQTSNVVSHRNNILPNGTVIRDRSSSNRDKEPRQLVPYENNGNTKVDKIDENKSPSPSEREGNDSNSPEDVKPNVQD